MMTVEQARAAVQRAEKNLLKPRNTGAAIRRSQAQYKAAVDALKAALAVAKVDT